MPVWAVLACILCYSMGLLCSQDADHGLPLSRILSGEVRGTHSACFAGVSTPGADAGVGLCAAFIGSKTESSGGVGGDAGGVGKNRCWARVARWLPGPSRPPIVSGHSRCQGFAESAKGLRAPG